MSNIYFTIYKITNQVNGKFYIGMHKTTNLDDNYMGSGKRIKQALKKYGPENFVKEYLGIYDTDKKMKIAEKIYVVIDELSYNLSKGGEGGFDYINENNLNGKFKSGIYNPSKTESLRKFLSQRMLGNNNPMKKEKYKKYGDDNVSKRDSVRRILSEQKIGKKLITDGVVTKLWDPATPLPEGFRLGRAPNF